MDEKAAAERPARAIFASSDRLKRAAPYAGLVLCAALALVPLVLGDYGRSLVAEVLLYCIFAMSLDLLMGYTGLMSFGHAAFFGIGAYTVAVLGVQFGLHPLLGMLAAVVLASLCAAVIGFFCIRASGVYFIMLTLAFAQLLYSVVIRWRSVTNGTDGITSPQLASGEATYYVVLAFFLIVYFGLRRLVAAPLGNVFIGIRENEMRMRAAGYATARFKLLSFVIGGGLGAIAGALFALHNGFVSPGVLFWMLSGEGMVMVILGGLGTLLGPIVGASVFIILEHRGSIYSSHWEFIVGATFIACVLFFKQGIYGWCRELLEQKSRP
ncbi:MAG: branched-chain amino acid ABC transporter permease [Betaproteobacteria bacterium]|nr:branched-chain amino acid ABC transporter permease [Betaproteobacteria bacterium]